MSLTPAYDQMEAQKKKDAIEKCGKNGGPHQYMPIEWRYLEEGNIKHKRVSRMLCNICFVNVSMKTLIDNYPDVSVIV